MLIRSAAKKILIAQKISTHFYPRNRNFFNKIANIMKNSGEPKQLKPPYNHITQIGDPILRGHANPVPEDSIQSKEVNLLVEQMIKTLRKYQLVGIAAPQIGINLRVIVMEFNENRKEQISETLYLSRQMELLPLTVFINPEMKIIDYNKLTCEEGCASVKGYAAEVGRHQEVLLNGFNIKGEKQNLTLKGWNARIAQHEMDHLNGTLYVDKMNSKTFRCTLWENINRNGGRIEMPYYK